MSFLFCVHRNICFAAYLSGIVHRRMAAFISLFFYYDHRSLCFFSCKHFHMKQHGLPQMHLRKVFLLKHFCLRITVLGSIHTKQHGALYKKIYIIIPLSEQSMKQCL